ncbi:hypothetical protein [Brachybacterium sp. GCM10030267]|uniref:hypothetical protein n=1 Tax=Brachybacterium sp. GCM10030267 TaxID=3273381 RepID=UPI0036709FE8
MIARQGHDQPAADDGEIGIDAVGELDRLPVGEVGGGAHGIGIDVLDDPTRVDPHAFAGSIDPNPGGRGLHGNLDSLRLGNGHDAHLSFERLLAVDQHGQRTVGGRREPPFIDPDGLLGDELRGGRQWREGDARPRFLDEGEPAHIRVAPGERERGEQGTGEEEGTTGGAERG